MVASFMHTRRRAPSVLGTRRVFECSEPKHKPPDCLPQRCLVSLYVLEEGGPGALENILFGGGDNGRREASEEV